ncbi:transposase [Caldisphaera sp.]|jgi:transposase|uniref:transposase n=1 Tax=Caldisphaera sp. TaxID=2060322 RepID=UPI003D1364B3
MLKNHLDAVTLEKLRRVFIEAKWFTNDVIAQGPFNANYMTRKVQVKVIDRFETRNITVLSSQMRQSIIDVIKMDILNLSKAKKNGKKVGKLKFRKHVKTIQLKQYGITYKIIDNLHIRVQNIEILKVNWLDQIPQDAEIANAQLINRHGDYYIHITTFVPNETKKLNGMHIGMDLGIKTQITLSNSVKVEYQIPPSEKLKELQRKLSRKKRGSKRYKVLLARIQKEYEHLTNEKIDIVNKIGSYLVSNLSLVSFQIPVDNFFLHSSKHRPGADPVDSTTHDNDKVCFVYHFQCEHLGLIEFQVEALSAMA